MSDDPLLRRLDQMFALADRHRRLDELEAIARAACPFIQRRMGGINALKFWIENELVRLLPAAVDDATARLDDTFKE